MAILIALGLALSPFILTAIIYWIVKTWEGKGAIGIAVVVFVFAFLLFYSIVDANAADLPEYTNLTFIDQADLDGQVDSVLAVCHQDSLYYLVDFYGNPDWIYFPVCRRFAGLTIMWMPEEQRPGIWLSQSNKGKARLWWWEKEE